MRKKKKFDYQVFEKLTKVWLALCTSDTGSGIIFSLSIFSGPKMVMRQPYSIVTMHSYKSFISVGIHLQSGPRVELFFPKAWNCPFSLQNFFNITTNGLIVFKSVAHGFFTGYFPGNQRLWCSKMMVSIFCSLCLHVLLMR